MSHTATSVAVERPFLGLLLALLALLFLNPLLHAAGWPLWLTEGGSFVLYLGTILTTIWVVADRPIWFWRAIVLAIAASSVLGAGLLLSQRFLSGLGQGLLVLLLLIGLWKVTLHLFSRRHVSGYTLCAALTAYLLMLVLFAQLYALAAQANPHAFRVAADARPLGGGLDMTEALYFSAVTLTTLGYGDITPLSLPARLLTAAQALGGQVYLIVLVGRLVGLQVANLNGDAPPPRSPD